MSFRAVNPPQNPIWDQGGEKITNGSFESNGGYTSQTFTGWEVTGKWCAVDGAHGYSCKQGSWAAYGGNFAYQANSLKHTFGSPVAVALITAFSFWRGLGGANSTQVKVTIRYSDTTTSTQTYTQLAAGYVQSDLMALLTAGKSVASVEFEDLGTTLTDILIDVVSMTANAAPQSSKLVYVPQTW